MGQDLEQFRGKGHQGERENERGRDGDQDGQEDRFGWTTHWGMFLRYSKFQTLTNKAGNRVHLDNRPVNNSRYQKPVPADKSAIITDISGYWPSGRYIGEATTEESHCHD
ncbi:hypothetical protein GCM10022265_07850 [Marinobacter xestospongiae]